MRGTGLAVSGSPPRRPCETGRSQPLLGCSPSSSNHQCGPCILCGRLAGAWCGFWVVRRRVQLSINRCPPPTSPPLCPAAQPCPHRHLPLALLPPGLIASPFPRLCIITAGVTKIRSSSASPAAGTRRRIDSARRPHWDSRRSRLLPAPRAVAQTPFCTVATLCQAFYCCARSAAQVCC